MVLQRSTVGRITTQIDDTPTTIDCRNIAVDQGANITTQQHSGLPEVTNALVSSAVPPRLSFDTSLKTALDTFGYGISEYEAGKTLEAVVGNLIGASIDTNSTHTDWGMQAAALASAWLDSWTVSEGSDAVASMVARYWSGDGDLAPLKGTDDVAFPALTAVPEIHSIGPVVINAVELPGVTGISYASGLTLGEVATSGKAYPEGGYPTSYDRRFTIQCSDPVAVLAALGDIGTKITTTTTITLYKSANDILSATGASIHTIAAGYVQPQTASGDHGDQFTGAIEIIPVSADGTTIPIVVS